MANGLFQRLKWQLILWLARRLPDCKRMTRRLGESLDRKLNRREKLMIKLHLFTCEACERYLEQVTFLTQAMQAHGDRDPDFAEFSIASLSSESKDRMKVLLRGMIGHAF